MKGPSQSNSVTHKKMCGWVGFSAVPLLVFSSYLNMVVRRRASTVHQWVNQVNKLYLKKIKSNEIVLRSHLFRY